MGSIFFGSLIFTLLSLQLTGRQVLKLAQQLS